MMEITTPAQLQAVMGERHPASPEQWAAITAPLEPVVVIAGAGSGKTTLMAARVVYLVLTGQVRPDEVLGLTFTTKATAQLHAKIRASLREAGALGESAEGEILEPTVSTYNAYAAALLSEHGLRIGHEPDTRVVTDAARYQLGARALDRHVGQVSVLTDHPPTAIQNLLALDGQLSEHLRTPADVRLADEVARRALVAERIEEEAATKPRKTYLSTYADAINTLDRRGELLDLVETYRRLKADLGLMDFSDQIALAARLAEEQPEVGDLERAKFKVVMLDEYQDTSTAQAIMLSRLFTGGHAVMAVGDPNQAIYGWRGASVSNILGFHEHFRPRHGEGRRYNLTVNRRSGSEILAVANELAAPLYEATPGVLPLVPDPRRGEGRLSAQVFSSQAEEHRWLAEEIARVHAAMATPSWSTIAVLTRDNGSAAKAYDVLSAAGIPVEIVGLSGLLRLPEVAEIVALLHLLHDVTANASLLTVLSGPRWAIGPRDLKLLASRARELAGNGPGSEEGSIAEALESIADGVDPSELAALDDALADPGEGDYSPEALERFAMLAAELRMLRSHASEPLLDVVRRVVDTTGVDIELASAVSAAAASRRDNLDLFIKAVADFQAIDGDVSMAALLAYLTAEDEQGSGMELATPSAVDSVKLLTVHRSKGLEFAEVFLIGVCETVFPSNRGRSIWLATPAELPSHLRRDAHDLPHLTGYDKAAIDAYRAAVKEHGAAEERRLGYVAFTRAEDRLSVTSFCWKETKTPLGPSEYQVIVRDRLRAAGVEVVWLDKPERGTPNPFTAEIERHPWPPEGPGTEGVLRSRAAALVASLDPAAAPADGDEGLDMIEAARVAEWDDEIGRLLEEARAAVSDDITVARPDSLSATALTRLREDPDAFARELARPMPHEPSTAARFGTRFHAWVEARFDQQDLFDLDDLPGAGDAGITTDAELDEVIAGFESGPFADRPPAQVEVPFALVLAGQVVRGRMDAVYAEPEGRWLIVDWKTSRTASADPLQLSIYRLAWAELQGVDPAQVRAAFYYVRSGQLVEPPDLLDRTELEALLGG
ncbi:ATP-dependent DNA helicase [Nocardioides sp.]|uniref:ATP-dependent DNA helicase n=1 Tax=Nocardioides sp. TaxID=35761 RepID=UPI00262A748B|nr:ATP-dependent DNA helicase [Nocardioides sp.]